MKMCDEKVFAIQMQTGEKAKAHTGMHRCCEWHWLSFYFHTACPEPVEPETHLQQGTGVRWKINLQPKQDRKQ